MPLPLVRRRCAALFTGLILMVAPILHVFADDFKPEPGFVELFNGRDLTGWSYETGEKFDGLKSTPDGRFSMENGIFVVHPREPRRAQKIFTQKTFPKDFVLRVEFRAAVNADSGIYLRKPQLQCRDYLVAGPFKDLKKYKPQDWNEIEVVVKDSVARATCNGELLQENIKLPETGGIGLEADRGQMEYRHLRIKETP